MFKTWLQCLSLPVGRLQKNETETWLGPITLLLPLFSHWVVSNSLWLHRLQHARLPCPSPSPRVCSNSCPLSQWCYPTISSFTAPFSSSNHLETCQVVYGNYTYLVFGSRRIFIFEMFLQDVLSLIKIACRK